MIHMSVYWLDVLLPYTESSAHLMEEHWDVQLDDCVCGQPGASDNVVLPISLLDSILIIHKGW